MEGGKAQNVKNDYYFHSDLIFDICKQEVKQTGLC